jgi:hypothetical protein
VDQLGADPCLVGRQVESEIAGDEDVVGRVRGRRCHVRRSGSPHAVLSPGRCPDEQSHRSVSTVFSQSRRIVKWTCDAVAPGKGILKSVSHTADDVGCEIRGSCNWNPTATVV